MLGLDGPLTIVFKEFILFDESTSFVEMFLTRPIAKKLLMIYAVFVRALCSPDVQSRYLQLGRNKYQLRRGFRPALFSFEAAIQHKIKKAEGIKYRNIVRDCNVRFKNDDMSLIDALVGSKFFRDFVTHRNSLYLDEVLLALHEAYPCSKSIPVTR